MDQVAGGEDDDCGNLGSGIGGTACYGIGVGVGSIAATKDRYGICALIGIGAGGWVECTIQGK